MLAGVSPLCTREVIRITGFFFYGFESRDIVIYQIGSPQTDLQSSSRL